MPSRSDVEMMDVSTYWLGRVMIRTPSPSTYTPHLTTPPTWPTLCHPGYTTSLLVLVSPFTPSAKLLLTSMTGTLSQKLSTTAAMITSNACGQASCFLTTIISVCLRLVVLPCPLPHPLSRLRRLPNPLLLPLPLLCRPLPPWNWEMVWSHLSLTFSTPFALVGSSTGIT